VRDRQLVAQGSFDPPSILLGDRTDQFDGDRVSPLAMDPAHRDLGAQGLGPGETSGERPRVPDPLPRLALQRVQEVTHRLFESLVPWLGQR